MSCWSMSALIFIADLNIHAQQVFSKLESLKKMDIFCKPPLNSLTASLKHLITAMRKWSHKNP